MQILDGKNHRRGAYEKSVGERVVHYLNGGKHWGHLDFVPDAHAPEAIEGANVLFLTTLQALVDQWIDSGIDPIEVEAPSRRYVRGLPEGYSVSLFDVLLGWLGRNMPKPALKNGGTIAIIDQRPNVNALDPETYAREMAILYLKELLESPALHRLNRCKNSECKKYFVRTRERKSEFKRGIYCGECELVGAAERTRLSRQRRKNQQLDVAAEAWLRWKESNRLPSQSTWVASQVNQKFPRLPGIKAKWVTQNKREILERTNKTGGRLERHLIPQQSPQ